MTLKEQLLETGLFIERAHSTGDRSTSLFIDGDAVEDIGGKRRAKAFLRFDSSGNLVDVRSWIDVSQ